MLRGDADKPRRTPLGIDEGMDLGIQSVPAAYHATVIRALSIAAPCGWILTQELSIIARSPPAPADFRRSKRLRRVVGGP